MLIVLLVLVVLCSLMYRELTDGSVADNDINKDSQLTLALRVQTGMKVCVLYCINKAYFLPTFSCRVLANKMLFANIL